MVKVDTRRRQLNLTGLMVEVKPERPGFNRGARREKMNVGWSKVQSNQT